jgi:hypothetical protein
MFTRLILLKMSNNINKRTICQLLFEEIPCDEIISCDESGDDKDYCLPSLLINHVIYFLILFKHQQLLYNIDNLQCLTS